MKGSSKLNEKKIIRFLNNQSSPKEKEEVSSWLDQRGAEQKLREILQNRWKKINLEESQKEARYHNLLEKIHHATIGKKKTRIIKMSWGDLARIVATFLLLLFSAYSLFQVWKPLSPELMEEVLVQVIERKTAAGEKLRITLPDQSKVILNSLSTISFDLDFGKMDRVIQLEGEAYFEITPDKDRLFQVQTGEVVTTALGTAFNAYSRNEQVRVSLTEGKVKVFHKINEVELDPGEMAALNKNGESLVLDRFDPDKTTAWKEGKIRFKSKTFGEIMATLEEWYGVTISVPDNIDQRRKVSGTFDNESLEDILNGLSFSMGLEHTINGKEVTIQPQPPMK